MYICFKLNQIHAKNTGSKGPKRPQKAPFSRALFGFFICVGPFGALAPPQYNAMQKQHDNETTVKYEKQPTNYLLDKSFVGVRAAVSVQECLSHMMEKWSSSQSRSGGVGQIPQDVPGGRK